MGKNRSCRRLEASDFLIGPTQNGDERVATPPEGQRRRALYGRTHGKTLRGFQARLVKELLPRLEAPRSAPLDCQSLFPFAAKEIWLEIGFGGGEHLIAQAIVRRDVGFIGAEPFVNGVAKALAAIERNKLDNIRLRAGDAVALIGAIPAGALSRVFILYPDPWPKRRHHKRRIISPGMVEELARVLRAGGEARFATDIDDYAGWTLRRFLARGAFFWSAQKADDWRKPWPDWRETRYEAKAKRAGRNPVYLTFVRT